MPSPRTSSRSTTGSNTKAPAPRKLLPTGKEPKKEKKLTLPVNELNAWLKDRHHWNHDDWLKLLANLENNGHKDFVSTEEGRHEIGRYLEKHRH